jgi:hypothetical protein
MHDGALAARGDPAILRKPPSAPAKKLSGFAQTSDVRIIQKMHVRSPPAGH